MKPGDTVSFHMGDLFPADDPLSEWLVLLAMSLNDLALVHDRLERDHASPHEYFYWLRLGVAHFFEAAKLLKRGRDIPEVAAYITTLPATVRNSHDTAVSIYDERYTELKMMRDVLFHYARVWQRRGHPPEIVVRLALEQLAPHRVTIKTGTLREARLLFADDVLATLFTRATGVPWADVAKDEVHQGVAQTQERIQEAITAFVRFANPALMDHLSRAKEEGLSVQVVEPVDPHDIRQDWKMVSD
jgi:hypothetical protein